MRNAFGLIHFGQSCKEAATEGVPRKKMFLKILQNSQENTCAGLRPEFLRTPILKNVCERLLLVAGWRTT